MRLMDVGAEDFPSLSVIALKIMPIEKLSCCPKYIRSGSKDYPVLFVNSD